MLDSLAFRKKVMQRKSLASAILYVGILAVMLIVMWPYIYGYRLSGDDIWYLRLAIEGIESVRDNAIAVAKEQGRIGQLLGLPLNAFGAWLSGDLAGRIVILTLYLVHFLLFSAYISLLVRLELQVFLLLLLVALHPLAFSFLPPNAYPLLNTVPFILILLARIAIVRRRASGTEHAFRMVIAQLVFVMGMTFSELAIVFGVSLLIAEYLARFEWSYTQSRQWRLALRDMLRGRFVIADGMAVLAVIVPYGLFRWWHPSMYEGNSAAGIGRLRHVLGTMLGHVRDGTAFPRLGGGLASASMSEVLVAILTGCLVTACLYAVARDVRYLQRPIMTAMAALLLAAFVCFPVALSPKYQDACMNRGACAYLDSRISYLWVSVAVMAGVAFICKHPLGRVTYRQALALCCVAIGVMAALISLYNISKAHQMVRIHQVWERADRIACDRSYIEVDKQVLLDGVDPLRLIAMNQPAEASDFWKLYIEWRRQKYCPLRSGQ